MKVYIIIINEVYDFEEMNHEPRVFATKESAFDAMRDIISNAKEEYGDDFNTIEETETSIEMYDDGTYAQSHYVAYIKECEVNM